MKKNMLKFERRTLQKSPTSIQGFDEITSGGLPKGRPDSCMRRRGRGKKFLICNGISCPGGYCFIKNTEIFISFEETEKELTANVSSLGFDLKTL